MQKLMGLVRRCVQDYNMITEGDHIGVGVSGGKDSVALAAGKDGKVMGAIGCAIFAVERGEWNGYTYPIISTAAAIVDGEKIKADTWYTVKNGVFVEWEG